MVGVSMLPCTSPPARILYRLINADPVLAARLVPDASWPIDTELENKVSRLGQARLSTSVWMACRHREGAASEAFIGDVLEEMRPVVRERLLYFWSKGIRGADFFISAIGPALSVFGRHSRVLRPDGGEVSVRDFLDIVRRESTDVALEQVLSGADLGLVDPLTRQYVTWVWSYSRAPLDAGEAIALWHMDEGCMCHPEERVQALCLHHLNRATPLGGMVLLFDLTLNLRVTEVVLRTHGQLS